MLLQLGEDFLDAVDGEQDQRDGIAGDRHAVAEFAHQGFGGVRQRLQPRQAEEAAGALDGVNEPENVGEDLGVVRLLLEAHELDVDHVETLVGLGQEFAQQVVHDNSLRPERTAAGPAPLGAGQCVGEAFNFGCERNGRRPCR